MIVYIGETIGSPEAHPGFVSTPRDTVLVVRDDGCFRPVQVLR